VTIQAYQISEKIEAADKVITPELQQRVVEAHPEVSFRALAGGRPMAHRKKSRAGRDERIAALASIFADDLATIRPPGSAARDDLFDACVCAWTAWRLATGGAMRLPQEPPVDSRGLRMEIVY
jgi:predicted RNase H-like nuclease